MNFCLGRNKMVGCGAARTCALDESATTARLRTESPLLAVLPHVMVETLGATELIKGTTS